MSYTKKLEETIGTVSAEALALNKIMLGIEAERLFKAKEIYEMLNLKGGLLLEKHRPLIYKGLSKSKLQWIAQVARDLSLLIA